jgi:hypothetical protein
MCGCAAPVAWKNQLLYLQSRCRRGQGSKGHQAGLGSKISISCAQQYVLANQSIALGATMNRMHARTRNRTNQAIRSYFPRYCLRKVPWTELNLCTGLVQSRHPHHVHSDPTHKGVYKKLRRPRLRQGPCPVQGRPSGAGSGRESRRCERLQHLLRIPVSSRHFHVVAISPPRRASQVLDRRRAPAFYGSSHCDILTFSAARAQTAPLPSA